MRLKDYIKKFGEIEVRDKDFVFYCDGKSIVCGKFKKGDRML